MKVIYFGLQKNSVGICRSGWKIPLFVPARCYPLVYSVTPHHTRAILRADRGSAVRSNNRCGVVLPARSGLITSGTVLVVALSLFVLLANAVLILLPVVL